MNPHQKNKIDINVCALRRPINRDRIADAAAQKLSADEQRLFRLYGKLPNKKDLLQNKLKVPILIQVGSRKSKNTSD